MKLALVCNSGGHLTEMLFLLQAFENHEIFFVTNYHRRVKQFKYKKYLLEYIGYNPWKMVKAFIRILIIFKKEKPDVIISTGAEIAIPAFFVAKLMKKKTIYLESWCRVKNKSKTGRILYTITDVFLVQWQDLLIKYGKKARYEGGVI
jgi:UDP-N-acetylglucosamine:LPS N-acetylglucosamine transferase